MIAVVDTVRCLPLLRLDSGVLYDCVTCRPRGSRRRFWASLSLATGWPEKHIAVIGHGACFDLEADRGGNRTEVYQQ